MRAIWIFVVLSFGFSSATFAYYNVLVIHKSNVQAASLHIHFKICDMPTEHGDIRTCSSMHEEIIAENGLLELRLKNNQELHVMNAELYGIGNRIVVADNDYGMQSDTTQSHSRCKTSSDTSSVIIFKNYKNSKRLLCMHAVG